MRVNMMGSLMRPVSTVHALNVNAGGCLRRTAIGDVSVRLRAAQRVMQIVTILVHRVLVRSVVGNVTQVTSSKLEMISGRLVQSLYDEDDDREPVPQPVEVADHRDPHGGYAVPPLRWYKAGGSS